MIPEKLSVFKGSISKNQLSEPSIQKANILKDERKTIESNIPESPKQV
jgi:hypothetical protein